MTQEQALSFQAEVYSVYRTYGRDLAWRRTRDPYQILVSEIMLQQTQVSRVVEKYATFLAAFPTIETLACATQRDVVALWSGLGYNRRALALHKCAQEVVARYGGMLPSDRLLLQELPGIGSYTAGAICAFAFGQSVTFIETNIRAVYLHAFFPEQDAVTDKQLEPIVAATLDHKNPREWYYALMDYGALLKQLVKNPSRRSAHHAKQSKFEGSERQIRGAIVRCLTQHATLSEQELVTLVARDAERVHKNLEALIEEGFVKQQANCYTLV